MKNFTLNKIQEQAVEQLNGFVLVIAGAGTGKTATLTHRIANLIDKGIDPENILAITFTNKAANEMKKRINKILGSKKSLNIGTFHSICLKFIKEFNPDINYTIIYEDDKKKIIKQLIKSNEYLEKTKDITEIVISIISSWKNNVILPDQAMQDAQSYNQRYSANIYMQYRAMLTQANSLDFDDLILEANIMLATRPEVSEELSGRFKYILVDEYQDCDNGQNNLILQLGRKHKNIFVVGDDSQAIYSWRNANIENILTFPKKYSSYVFKLEENYRSTEHIIAAANRLITNNMKQIPKTLFTTLGSGNKIILYEAQSSRDEATWIAARIKSLIANSHLSYKDIAILYRTSKSGKSFESTLMANNIPYDIVGTIAFYERKEVKDIIAYLRYIVNPNDIASFTRAASVPRRGIGDQTLAKIIDLCNINDISLSTLLNNIDEYKDLSRTSKKLKAFAEEIESIRQMLHNINDNLNVVLYALMEQVGYKAMLTENSNNEPDDDGLENYYSFIESIKQLHTKEANAFQSIISLLDTIKLNTSDEHAKFDSVSMMTLHSAKGLEYPVVFIANVVQGTIPHAFNNNMEEERRLFYVGITRAQKQLYISYSKIDMIYSGPVKCKPSQFLFELPAANIIRY